MWFGTQYGGVCRFDGTEFKTFMIKDGLAENIVRAIETTPDGVLWFGTEGGVSRYDGEKSPPFPKGSPPFGKGGNRSRQTNAPRRFATGWRGVCQIHDRR